MVSGNGLNAVKHHHRPMMEDERHRRRELQLLEDQKSATLSFFSTKDRTIAAKMLVVEAHRYQLQLQSYAKSEKNPMADSSHVRDVVDDIAVLMGRVPPHAARQRDDPSDELDPQATTYMSSSTARPTQDYYSFVKNELWSIDMWCDRPKHSRSTPAHRKEA